MGNPVPPTFGLITFFLDVGHHYTDLVPYPVRLKTCLYIFIAQTTHTPYNSSSGKDYGTPCEWSKERHLDFDGRR